MSKQDRIDAYRKQLGEKPERRFEKNLESYQRYLARQRDTFFQQSPPDELTDGDRVFILKEVLSAKS